MRGDRGAKAECCPGGSKEDVQIQGCVNHVREGVGKFLLELAIQRSLTTRVIRVLVGKIHVIGIVSCVFLSMQENYFM